MKTKSFFALAMMTAATLSFVACNGKGGDPDEKPTKDVTLTLDQTSVEIEVGGSVIVNATVTPAGTAVAWTSLSEEVATVTDGIIMGVSEGTTIVIATAGDKRATVNVKVGKGATIGGKTYEFKNDAEKYYPIFVDGATLSKMEGKIGYNFSVDDVNNFFYPWVVEGTDNLTYNIVDNPTGMNFYGTAEGGYIDMIVGTAGWAGGGYMAAKDDVLAFLEEVKADPDRYYFHIGMKSTTEVSDNSCFYFFGDEATHFTIGAVPAYNAPVWKNYATRDGYWNEFDYPLSLCAKELSTWTPSVKPADTGVYIWSFLTEGIAGERLTYDAVYFYKK
ncbi:MAG: Ig-like domain-containing protein [Paludibacter sp.]|nr:Ig-like domain-containing protein [Bacteroidales bacterium]MCM1069157.1 Ig-like domain-containing protein [Prevotella sp.]MCM1353596.1 Ig-like domain-containing protein [Bacteroides sp.]MCM1442757.1 Ig-like domain-containing protein [Muribaculum sp.]MCM1481607.1 Ig-like domain-containing protein [Paludibacter sp.]